MSTGKRSRALYSDDSDSFWEDCFILLLSLFSEYLVRFRSILFQYLPSVGLKYSTMGLDFIVFMINDTIFYGLLDIILLAFRDWFVSLEYCVFSPRILHGTRSRKKNPAHFFLYKNSCNVTRINSFGHKNNSLFSILKKLENFP